MCLTFLLFILPGATSVAVEGQKGSNITLKCSLSNREDLTTVLTFGPITAYGFNLDERFRGRVHKSGSCDLILQDLKTTDAGKYMADVYDNSGLISCYAYDVRVKANVSGQKCKELKFDYLPREAESVEHLTDAGWTEVWRRGKGVLTDRLTIKNFSSSDAGIYRVLNSSGEVLVTVTVTESKDKLESTHEDENHDTVQVLVAALAALIAFGVIKLEEIWRRRTEMAAIVGLSCGRPVYGSLMYRLLLLLLGCVDYSGTTSIPVTGEKGGNITLTCEVEDRGILEMSLSSRSEIIFVCQTEECSGRVFKQRNCDVFFKDLSFSDAGKYFMRVYYNNNQTELERQIRTYQLCVHNEVSVKIGEELKLDVLLSDADEVQHQSRRSTEWMKVWSRTDGVQRERITIRDRNLIINEFTPRDTGTYRVLDPDEEPLITVTVTESKEKLDDTDKDKTDDTKYHSRWSLAAPLTVLLLALIVTAVLLLKHRHRSYLKGAASKGKGGLSTEDPEALKDLVDIC